MICFLPTKNTFYFLPIKQTTLYPLKIKRFEKKTKKTAYPVSLKKLKKTACPSVPLLPLLSYQEGIRDTKFLSFQVFLFSKDKKIQVFVPLKGYQVFVPLQGKGNECPFTRFVPLQAAFLFFENLFSSKRYRKKEKHSSKTKT